MDNRKEIRVTLQLDPDSWHGTSSEGIWTRLVVPPADRTNVKAIVEVDNIPFFSKALSLGDNISVDFNRGIPMFDAVVERGGHSTYRLFIEKHGIKASHMLDAIKAMGCDWEMIKFNGGELYALDVPPAVDIHEVYEILEKGQKEGAWSFEEGYVGHPLKGDPISNLS
jgi:uncharacterized protein DUF4265